MDNMDELYRLLSDNTVVEETENVIMKVGNEELQYDQPVTIKVPKVRNTACIDIKNLKQIQKMCKEVKKEKFSFAELFLGISTSLFGAALGAFVSGVPYIGSLQGIFSYTVCPIAGVVFFAMYWNCRTKNTTENKVFAEKILDCISDSIEEEEEDEH